METTTTRQRAVRQAEMPGRLRREAAGNLLMLIVQFGLGIGYNLFGTMPASHEPLGMLSGGPVLILHEIMGLALLIAAIRFTVLAIRAGERVAVIAAVTALLAIVGAAAAGMSFLGNGADGASQAMATAAAMISYTVCLRPPGAR